MPSNFSVILNSDPFAASKTMALLTALVFLALAATCKTLDLGYLDRCPCKKEHTTDFINKWLVYKGTDNKSKNHSNFGIGCRAHKIDQELANRIYDEHNMASQLSCYDGPKASGPWCKSKWCYIDEDKNCSLDWKHGRLGLKYSHATCGNLAQGWPDYAIKSFAADLKGDPLRVLHLESTLDGGYMGNSDCEEDRSASGASRVSCGDSLLAAFWRRSLERLEKFEVKVEPVLIKKNHSIDDHFKNITDSFHNYSEQGNNFDLCAFATGLGWVDLCSGTVAMTPERQEMTHLIELYATPAFMVSKSICILGKPWWWIEVFSPEAWGFFGLVVFIFTALMHVFDDDFRNNFCNDCIDRIPPGNPRTWDRKARQECRSACGIAASSLFTCILGIGEAFIQQKPRRVNHETGKNEISRASRCVRSGLRLFIFVTTTLYASSLTSELIARRENGKYPSLEEAEKNISGVTVCLHQVYRTSMKLPESPNSKIKLVNFTDWEELKEGLVSGPCDAAIVEEDGWNTWRARGELCNFYKSPTATFHMATGAPVSQRAYRTLETFRFNTSALADFELGSHKELKDKFQDRCSMSSNTGTLCENTGAAWHAFGTVALIACVGLVIGFLVLLYEKCCRGSAQVAPDEPRGREDPEDPGDKRPPDAEAQSSGRTEPPTLLRPSRALTSPGTLSSKPQEGSTLKNRAGPSPETFGSKMREHD